MASTLDYRIGSVHFLPCGDGYVDVDGRFDSFKIKMERFFDNDIPVKIPNGACRT